MSLRLSCFLSAFLALLLLATWMIRDTLGEILHFQSDIVLHFFQSLRIHELCERIQLLLVEQSQKVIAKSPHFTISIQHEILEYSGTLGCHQTGLFNIDLPLQSLLLRLGFGPRSLSHALLVEQDDVRRLIFGVFVFGVPQENDGHLVHFHQYV